LIVDTGNPLLKDEGISNKVIPTVIQETLSENNINRALPL